MHCQNIFCMFNRCEQFNEFDSDNSDHKSLDFVIMWSFQNRIFPIFLTKINENKNKIHQL